MNSNNVYLYLLAEHYGIDYEKKGISVRGHIYWAEYEENVEDDYALLSFDTESAWSSCDLFFEEVNKALGDELSISWREVEPGCDIFYTHDENDFFPEECYVTAYGELFEEDVYKRQAHMYIVAGAATALTLFGLEVLTLVFGGLGRRRTMIVFSASKKEFVDAMFERLESKDYSVISYEVETQRTSDGVVHRATIVIRAKGQASEEGYIDLLRANPDITVEKIV